MNLCKLAVAIIASSQTCPTASVHAGSPRIFDSCAPSPSFTKLHITICRRLRFFLNPKIYSPNRHSRTVHITNFRFLFSHGTVLTSRPATSPLLTRLSPSQSSEARLYTFPTPTRDCLKKLRMSTVRKPHPIARIFSIDKTTHEVAPESEDEYTSLEEIVDELPDHAPRFVLLSYPVTRGDGRKATPYVLLAWVSFYHFPARLAERERERGSKEDECH